MSLPPRPTDREIKLELVELVGPLAWRDAEWKWNLNLRENRDAVIAAIAAYRVRLTKVATHGPVHNPGGWMSSAYDRQLAPAAGGRR